jgi:hypothetical protein
MADWKKGDNRILAITRTNIQNGEGASSRRFEFTHAATITVLDKTDSGYTLQWVYHFPADFKLAHPLLADSIPIYEGLKIIYHTTTTSLRMEDGYLMLIRPKPSIWG